MRIALSATNLGLQPGDRSLQIACLISLISDRVTWTYCGPIRGCDDGPQWRHWLPQGVVEDRQSSVDFRPTPHTLKSCLPQQRELRRRGRDTAESAPHLHRTVLRQRPHDCGPEQPEWWRRSRLGRIRRCAARRASPRASARAAQDTIEPVAHADAKMPPVQDAPVSIDPWLFKGFVAEAGRTRKSGTLHQRRRRSARCSRSPRRRPTRTRHPRRSPAS